MQISLWVLNNIAKRCEVSAIKDIQSIRMEVQEGFLSRRVLYIKIKGQPDIPLSRIEEYFTLREMEDKAAELARFLKVSIEGI